MAPSADRILQLLANQPGLKARQIAEELGLDRADVVAALDQLPNIVQDAAYRWWPKGRVSQPSGGAGPARTFLANLCRYYLECLARESGPSISLVASETSGYVELTALPFTELCGEPPATMRAVKRLAQKVARERGQLTLYIGYALRIVNGRIEPLLLYPLDEPVLDSANPLRPGSEIPLFNLEVLKSLPAADSGNLLDEAIQLSEELGLADPDEDPPNWDELVVRLHRSRPDWEWRESLNPWTLSQGTPLSEDRPAGFYNRAILLAGTRSPFTYGLEAELRKLMTGDEAALRGTALGHWLGEERKNLPVPDRPILEVLPLNSEQRQAVIQGLSSPLTVVTGPPGTGKSQVVTSLLANMAWQGATVLFSSRNNHAVDVVETRVNDLGAYPLLLRLGKEEHQARIAQDLVSRLADTAGPDENRRYARLLESHRDNCARYAAIQQQIAAVARLRNRVDELERTAEPARSLFSTAEMGTLRDADPALTKHPEEAAKFQNYLRSLDELREARPLEDLALDLTRISHESSVDARELWQSWLRLWPNRLPQAQRRLLSEYVALLQMISGAGRPDEGLGRAVFRRYYKLFPKVLESLPCWAVTSLSARGRLPFEPAQFDLVIIDEASQCDIASALPLLFRAKRAVIIGDPLQLKHVSAVAPQMDRLTLAAHGLAEGNASWAYSVNSLFDLARSICRPEDLVNLRDHHRSHRDIIGFSNRHFYRGRLRVATDHEALLPTRGEGSAASPAVRWVDLKGKVIRPQGGGAVNGPEAEAVAAEVRRLAVDLAYRGSIGVVTPFRAQANRIRTLIHQDATLARQLGESQFVVDTVHGFQGDERDVILFSPVISLGATESMLRFLKGNGNLFNVAITRARSELIVIGDVRAALHSEVNYLAGFAEYARGLAGREQLGAATAELGPEYPPVAHPEFVSEWERVLYRALYRAGLRPVPQYDEPPYMLDFALFAPADSERKLNIEVDGENYHRDWDGELCRRDQLRSRRLADQGWDVMRFWVYEVRDDLEGCVRRAKQWTESQ